MPPRAADQKNAIPAAPPVAGGSRLEQLPSELIQSIFDSLHIFDEPHQADLIRPLSKHLHPYSKATLYRLIQICDDVDLGQLCTTISETPALATLVVELELLGFEVDVAATGRFSNVLMRMVENLLLSLKNLKRLEVDQWNMVGKVVLSSRFGKEGGQALESIRMVDCFGSIEGSLSEAWSHLRHLPVLSSIVYYNNDLSIAAEAAIPTNLGGFAKVTELKCFLHNFSSTHATNFASLFPSTIQQIELTHLNEELRPNYSPFLDSLSPGSITSINLNISTKITVTSMDQFPVHQSLIRFPRLQHLKFYDHRIFDSELIEAIHELNLTSLEIHRNCKLSYDLIHQILSGIKQDSSWKKVTIGVDMEQGSTGRTYRDGVKTVVDDAGNLIPGEGWKRPDWSIITLPEARELMRISIEKGIELDGQIKWGLRVERAFEEEEKWLKIGMTFLRTGLADCTDCGKKN